MRAKPSAGQHHPRALQLLRFLRAYAVQVLIGILVMIAWVSVLSVAAYGPAEFGLVAGVLVTVYVLLFLGGACLYLLTVAFFFARFSLGQMLAAVFFIGTCMCAFVQLDFEDSLYFVFLIILAVTAIVAAILRQDPCGENETPQFIQRERANRVIERIHQRRAAQARSTGEDAAHA